jgi:multidrug resistance efflux pump
MNDLQAPRHEQVAPAPAPARPADPLRRWTLAILVISVLLFGWTLIADRLTPYTSDASARSFVVRMRPEVSGKIIEVGVRDNLIVHAGDLLYRIDPTPFGIAVERAEAKLASAGQTVGASTAAVDAAQAELMEEIAQLLLRLSCPARTGSSRRSCSFLRCSLRHNRSLSRAPGGRRVPFL